MKIEFKPSEVKGTIDAPPSKSMTHRLLICAALASDESNVKGVSESEDISATIDCLRELGARIDCEKNRDDLMQVKITGTDVMQEGERFFDCRECGTTLRLMIPIAALARATSVFTGSKRLMERPLTVYENVFHERGLLFERESEKLTVRGHLPAGKYEVDGSISSQFVSGLLLALPLTDGDSAIRLSGKVESMPYIDMTIDAMKRFGVNVMRDGQNVFVVPGAQKYKATDVTVEGDWSNAAFLLAIGADVRGLNEDSLQGDKVCRKYFVELREHHATLDISDCPDLGPVLMAYASLHHGVRLIGTKRLSIKESDRGLAMKEELAKFGVKVEIEENSIDIGAGAKHPTAILDSHNDHRIAMALSVICANLGGAIEGAEAVNKSYPEFFDDISKLGASDWITKTSLVGGR